MNSIPKIRCEINPNGSRNTKENNNNNIGMKMLLTIIQLIKKKWMNSNLPKFSRVKIEL